MKFVEDRKIKMKSAVEITGSLKVHVKTVIDLPATDTKETKKIIEMFRQIHQGVDDFNQVALPLDEKKGGK